MMIFGKLARALAPLVAVVAFAATAGCDKADVRIDGEQGKPLAELDLGGEPPRKLVLLGPDDVRIASGSALAIKVDGDAALADSLRFTLKDGTLGIMRRKGALNGTEKVTVNVTMPPPEHLTLAGSGTIHAAAIAPNAKIVVAGSGSVTTPTVEVEKLEVTLAGSGRYTAGGKAGQLDLTIAGSGAGEMSALNAQDVSVTVAGSGSSHVASDGIVKAKIMGPGEVRVRGRARCEVQSMGSGRLVCEAGEEEAA